MLLTAISSCNNWQKSNQIRDMNIHLLAIRIAVLSNILYLQCFLAVCGLFFKFLARNEENIL